MKIVLAYFHNEKNNLRLNIKRTNCDQRQINTARESINKLQLFSISSKKHLNTYLPPKLNSRTSINQIKSPNSSRHTKSIEKFVKKSQDLVSNNLNRFKIKSPVDKEPSNLSERKLQTPIIKSVQNKAYASSWRRNISLNNNVEIHYDNSSILNSNNEIESVDNLHEKDGLQIFSHKFNETNSKAGLDHKPARVMYPNSVNTLLGSTEWTKRRLQEHTKNFQDPNNKIKHIFKNYETDNFSCNNNNKSLQEKHIPKILVKKKKESFLQSICLKSLSKPNNNFTSRLQSTYLKTSPFFKEKAFLSSHDNLFGETNHSRSKETINKVSINEDSKENIEISNLNDNNPSKLAKKD